MTVREFCAGVASQSVKLEDGDEVVLQWYDPVAKSWYEGGKVEIEAHDGFLWITMRPVKVEEEG